MKALRESIPYAVGTVMVVVYFLVVASCHTGDGNTLRTLPLMILGAGVYLFFTAAPRR